MLAIVFAVLVLVLVQAGLVGRYLADQVGNATQMGPRDDLPPPSLELRRARNAQRNLHETLPVFLTLAILSIVLAEQGWVSLLGAGAYLLGRIAHLVCYIKGLTPWRSITFGVSMLGIFTLGAPLVAHLAS